MISRMVSRGGLAAIAGTALFLAAASTTAQAGPIVPFSKSVIGDLNSNLTDVGWRRCWRDRWGRMRCTWCWRNQWGRVVCR